MNSTATVTLNQKGNISDIGLDVDGSDDESQKILYFQRSLHWYVFDMHQDNYMLAASYCILIREPESMMHNSALLLGFCNKVLDTVHPGQSVLQHESFGPYITHTIVPLHCRPHSQSLSAGK